MKYQRRRHWKYRLYEDQIYQTGINPPPPAYDAAFVPAIDTQFISLTVDGVITVKAGYVWDGASGPTFDTKNTFMASLIHDALYQLMRNGLLDRKWRKRADKIMYEILRSRGMWKVRAKIWYRAVRIGAGPDAESDVLTAP